MPFGKVSTNAAVRVLSTTSGLLIVIVRVEIPPTLIELGTKVLLIVGSTASRHTEITALSKVTAPLRARMRPLLVAPVLSVILESASKLPIKAVVVPNVAELPTCQNTLQLWPPLITCTAAPLAVVNALPTWKINIAF